MFDTAKANNAVKFIEKLKHTKSPYAGQPFKLERWQKRIVRDIFGNVNADGNRQYRTAYMEVARKNGKSELAAPIALYLLYADGEIGAEIYGAAADTDQAAIVFNVAAQMIRQEPELNKRSKILDSTKRILYPPTNSLYRVLSADHATKHGFNASGVIFDELHTQPNRLLWDVLTTSGGTREQPLTFAITTAGFNKQSICWEQHEYARKLIEGIFEDETFYPVIFALEKNDDWRNPKLWKKANPALGTFRKLEEMQSLFNKAQNIPALQNTFRRLYLNQWTSQEDRWLDLKIWNETAGTVVKEDLYEEICYGGLDLASTSDLAALALVFPDIDGCFDVLPFFWVPKARLDDVAEKNRNKYQTWADQGYVNVTNGNVIDYREIRKTINELGEKHYIKEIAFDRWGATEMMQSLEDDGFTMIQFGQGYKSMAPPTRELLKLCIERRIRHNGHPVLSWMADNMVVTQDPAGNLKPDKGKSNEKIDGMVALIMGLDRAIRNNATSVYDDRGIITI